MTEQERMKEIERTAIDVIADWSRNRLETGCEVVDGRLLNRLRQAVWGNDTKAESLVPVRVGSSFVNG